MIAIIGGSGFIGTYIIDHLLENNINNFYILDIKNSVKYNKYFHYCDIRNYDQLFNSLLYAETVINLAAVHSDAVSSEDSFTDTNVCGSNNLCKVLSILNIKKIIFLSSVAVYKNNFVEINEDSPKLPSSIYGKSKLLAENIYIEWFEKNKSERSLIIIRPTVVFGPGNRGNLYNLINCINKNKFIMVGTGDNIKSVCYVKNLVHFIFYLKNINHSLKITNYVDKPDIKMSELINLIYKNLNKKNFSHIHLSINLVKLIITILYPLKLMNLTLFSTFSNRLNKFTQNSIFIMNDNSFVPIYKLDKALEITIKSDFKK
jgi:nucleoside-diphosphate-sugar epimerase